MAMAKCPHCGAENAEGSAFCAGCGKALPSATPTGPRVVTGEAMAATSAGRSVQEDQLRKQAKQACIALFAVAVLQVLAALLLSSVLRESNPRAASVVLAVLLVLAAIYTGLGFWARVNPLPAAIVGLVLYVSLVVLDLVADPSSLARGWLIKLLIVIVLAKAVEAGVKYRQFKAQAGQSAGPAAS